ncbi:MAG: hypothetical protein JWM34_3240 [Ilumatobacteraceae bacterium]|nr:hypothetical protein [Ilumatobacteraceae bacterium]
MSYKLEDRYTANEGRIFLSGVQALARLPHDQLVADRKAGLTTAALVSGYPGSPLGGFDGAVRQAASQSPDLPISCRPALNEEYAATAVFGSQLASSLPDAKYDGVVGIWYGKAPGVDRATDALRHGVFAGTSPAGGVVALVGDDPTAKSSSLPSSSIGILSDLHMPVLYPGDPAAALKLGRHAVALSRYCGLWVALKIVADVADGTAAVDLSGDAFSVRLPETDLRYDRQPDGRLLTPHSLDLEREIYEVRYELARLYAAENSLNVTAVNPRNAWLGIVSSGITYHEIRAALARLGLAADDAVASAGIRVLNLQMPLPFDRDAITLFAQGLDEILIIEEKQPHLELLIKDALYGSSVRPCVVGKTDELGGGLVPTSGGLDADRIVPVLRRRLEGRLGDRLVPHRTGRDRLIPVITAARSPYYCSGCPHNRSTETPDGSLVGAGIGCHTMTLMMEPERVGDIIGLTAMGNEGTQWIGMSDFVDTGHFIQNVGDGTYFHSAQLAVTAAIAARVNITYKLLYNGAVAMTGGQHPQGQLAVPDVVKILIAQGVSEVMITTDKARGYDRTQLPKGIKVWDRTRVVEAQKYLASIEGVTVMIHDQACAAELRRARKRGRVEMPTVRIAINDRVCEGCGDCGRVSNCLSVQPLDTAFGRKTTIDQASCNLDYSCIEGDCPSFMTVDSAPSPLGERLQKLLAVRAKPSSKKARGTSPDVSDLLAKSLPDPVAIVPTDDFAMRIAGIGGTGVVTVAQIIGTAAMLAGHHVRGLDQVGLSQKAGPVVSDVRISSHADIDSNRVGIAEADLLLVLDQIVGSGPKTLETAEVGRTIVVGSTSTTPSGATIRHPEVPTPSPAELGRLIASRTSADHQYWADLAALATELLGGAAAANVIAIGMAVQSGSLPIPAELIEEAITVNGAAVKLNIDAFRLGRHIIYRPDEIPTTSTQAAKAPAQRHELEAGLSRLGDEALRAEAARFAYDLIEFQDLECALEYLDLVGMISDAERNARPNSRELTAAVVANLYRVTAYKDEYEVARLLVDPAARSSALASAGQSGRVRYHLHPPLLRKWGMESKMTFGTWADPAFRMLAKGKRLRGTWMDPFGRADVRRVERDLVEMYSSALRSASRRLHDSNFDVVMRIAALPDGVRGYEHLKLERAETFKRDLAVAMKQLG